MNNGLNIPSSPVLYLSHGGGPLPLLGDKGHQSLVNFFKKVTPTLGMPTAILVISAHWEEDKPTITSGAFPSLIYDYYGFPKESYEIKYPAPGSPELANKIFNLLGCAGIEAKLDPQRGFDHGFVCAIEVDVSKCKYSLCPIVPGQQFASGRTYPDRQSVGGFEERKRPYYWLWIFIPQHQRIFFAIYTGKPSQEYGI